jgi:hypothetical protein
MGERAKGRNEKVGKMREMGKFKVQNPKFCFLTPRDQTYLYRDR